MSTYIFRRVLWFIPVLFSVGLITFLIARSTPGGPFDTDPNRRQLNPNTEKVLRAKFGFINNQCQLVQRFRPGAIAQVMVEIADPHKNDTYLGIVGAQETLADLEHLLRELEGLSVFAAPIQGTAFIGERAGTL